MRPHGRASVSPRLPRAHAICDRCGFRYNHWQLQWQYQWAGPKLQNLRVLVCQSCLDAPQEQLRVIVIPPDPVPIQQPRVEAFTQDDAPISGLGTNAGTLIQGGGLAAAFSGGVSKPLGWSALILSAAAGLTNTVGKQWSASSQPIMADAESQQVNVTSVVIYAPTDAAFSTTGAIDYEFQGSNDGTTWTVLASGTTVGDIAEILTLSPTSGDYSYHQLAFDGTAGGAIAVAQMVIYGTGLSGQN